VLRCAPGVLLLIQPIRPSNAPYGLRRRSAPQRIFRENSSETKRTELVGVKSMSRMPAPSVPKLAIIGASGFIGLRTVELLSTRTDLDLVPLVRSAASLAVLARQPLAWRITSFLDEAALSEGLRGCDVCIHAAIGDAAQIVRMAETTYQACATAGVRRLVWLSSASVHGQNCPPNTDESTPLRDDHPLVYNNAKVRAEWALERRARDHRVEVIRLRPSVVFGPRSRWVADPAADLQSRAVGWINGGRGICNSIYVDNLVEAIRLAAVTPGIAGEAFLVGDAETVRWRDFLEPIAEHFGFTASTFVELPVPSLPAERENRLHALTLTAGYGRFTRVLPDRVKRLVKSVLHAWPEPIHPPSGWTLRPTVQPPRLTHELALLQQCKWKLPHTHAAERLSYKPPVTFAAGMSRSLAWLDFIEGRSQN
jgi:2-alkyl-3-oxoalkanoate reductase